MTCFANDSDLLDALRGRDTALWRRAYLCLMRTEGVKFRGRFLRNGFGWADVEEMIQDVFLKMARSLDQLRGASSFRAWLWKIADSVEKDASRRNNPRRADRISLDDEGNPESAALMDRLATTETGPRESLERAQFLQCLDEAFGRFERDHPDYAAYVTAASNGETGAELASKFGKKPGAMREMLSQAREILRQYSAHCRQ